ncbi:hypothetical protein [Pontibacter arcticus]|uniref:Lipoprotein n=1 Tax=Pontibacter arcticus TaxID=2080288 RepID=A0A364RER4_9BACT|nr:hypothetical protein [Pontibacter arcticus]RAU82801.1 hypothetical protein DP923_05990 [Pontibacter arcticus]
MKILSTFILSASTLLLISCSDKADSTQSSGITGAPVNFSSPGSAQPAANAAPGAVNPAHGAPGHNCAIPVGAPLNAPAGTQATQPAVQTEPAPQLTPQTQGIASPAVNPAHGAPGHDCAIPVGAPLSK